MKSILLSLVVAAAAYAQTAAMVAPAASSTISGTTYTLTSTCTGCTAVWSAEYDIDGELAGISRTPPYSLRWDTFYANNGPAHQIAVTYSDVLGNVIASSPAV